MLFDENIAKDIVTMVRSGKTLGEICAREDTPHLDRLYEWFDQNPYFAHNVTDARYQRVESLAESVLDDINKAEDDITGEKDIDSIRLQLTNMRVNAKLKLADLMGLKKKAERKILAEKVVYELPFEGKLTISTDKLLDEPKDLPADHPLLQKGDHRVVTMKAVESDQS